MYKIIDIPGKENEGKLVFTIDNFLNNKECDKILQRIKNKNFQKATIGHNKKTVENETRNNSRTYFEDSKFSQELWKKFKDIDIYT